MAHETILVVDDNTEIVRVLTDYMLSPLGYQILAAANGKEGLKLAVNQAPDLILLDMNMPYMSGMEMLTALRQTDCRAPVIFMTLHGSESVAVEAFRLGVCNYLIKPFSGEEVQSAVDAALREGRLAREKEALTRNMIATETIRQTTVTLAHYINNALMTLMGGLSLIEEELKPQAEPKLLQIISESYDSASKIEAILRVLQQVTKAQESTYHGELKMIDIEAALQEELRRTSRRIPGNQQYYYTEIREKT
jgi:DNA-binding response OmpR family regulator